MSGPVHTFAEATTHDDVALHPADIWLAAAAGAFKGLQLVWKQVSGKEPPLGPDDQQAPLGRAVIGGLQGEYFSPECAPGKAMDEHLSDSTWVMAR